MRRGWKILIAVAVAAAALLLLNTIAVDSETKSAEVTVEGGRILSLPAGELQITDTGPTRVASTRRRRAGERPPIVLLHCYACSLRWWDGMVPILARDHRVVRIDLLGHGGSEKPSGGYAIEDQAALVAAALERLGVEGAVVVGHSMGFSVATALAEQSSQLVDRLVNIDEGPTVDSCSLSFTADLVRAPVLGEAMWRLSPDFAIEDGYGPAFAPGYDIDTGFENRDQVVDDYRAMTFTSFDKAKAANDAYREEIPVHERARITAIPLLSVFGAEDETCDPEASQEAYEEVPGARTATIDGAGHSPNVERPRQTARLILEFAANPSDVGLEHPVPKRFRREAKRRG